MKNRLNAIRGREIVDMKFPTVTVHALRKDPGFIYET